MDEAETAPRKYRPLSLKLMAVLALVVIAAFSTLLVWQRIEDTRRSVREEVEAASIVASQVLTRVSWSYERAGVPGMVQFLDRLGHVRANDISLYDDEGRLIYRSPAATYKAGREAPACEGGSGSCGCCCGGGPHRH